MAFALNDQIYTQSFTPKEYQVELLMTAKKKNIIMCLDKQSEQLFVAVKLIQELAINNRKAIKEGGKRIIYLFQNEQYCLDGYNYLQQLTDLDILMCCKLADFDSQIFSNSTTLLISTIDVCNELLITKNIKPNNFNLIVLNQCHSLLKNDKLSNILNSMCNIDDAPRIVGFAIPLFQLGEKSGQLTLIIEKIESLFHCQVETASEILCLLHYNTNPREYYIEYKNEEISDLEKILEGCALHALQFLEDHRYDPLEIYTEEFLEDIQKIPDPVKRPCEMITDFLNILRNLGSWCADRAALIYLLLIEKLKIKTPYERHYLLLNVVATLFYKVRSICDNAFQELTEVEKIKKFSKPRIQKLIQVLANFSPSSLDNYSSKQTNTNNNNNNNNHCHNTNKAKIINSHYHRKHNRNFRPNRYNKGSGGPSNKSDQSHSRPIIAFEVPCGVIFAENIVIGKVLFYLISEVSKNDRNLNFLSPLYLDKKSNDEVNYIDREIEHKKQEEVLKKFRMRECNLLIAMSIMEEGIEIPKSNYVIRFDFPKNYQSYMRCKSIARTADAIHCIFIEKNKSREQIERLAHYCHLEKIFLSKCFKEPAADEQEENADLYASLFPEYCPLGNPESEPKVGLKSAIALINRYCAKLPSDTFTKLTPEYTLNHVRVNDDSMYICFLRLPINSPLKYVVASYPMPSKALAKRMAAYKMSVHLHQEKELDDYLQPIGKEHFTTNLEDAMSWEHIQDKTDETSDIRPGTTKRRQYYYKKVAESLTDCKPEAGNPCYLYHISMTLNCPLPEEQNTRGRKIYPPEESPVSFGILTTKKIPKINPFPIYTRSGEVLVALRLSQCKVTLNELQIEKIVSFLNYTFTNVLRLQKYLMKFDPNASENSYFIVPVCRPSTVEELDNVAIDWHFLDCIYDDRNCVPQEAPESEREHFEFDESIYEDAVIMPWYRNQDQPQYFYVAEICYNLSPKSDFPGLDYKTFEEYYFKKYGIQIMNLKQPLLDVDHTSARLNFLTPRYVNRKGVALQTSSEQTKRAKRENLEQKQILVAELCSIHPFPASLWRQAVCLPCVLYRINALLLADQIRVQVAREIGLGQESLAEGFEWPPLNFGWSLADVLAKSRADSHKHAKKLVEGEEEDLEEDIRDKDSAKLEVNKEEEESVEEDEEDDEADKLEIGTWSNDLAAGGCEGTGEWNGVRYGSPTLDSDFDGSESERSYAGGDGDDYCTSSGSDREVNEENGQHHPGHPGLRITYMGDNTAEAIDRETGGVNPLGADSRSSGIGARTEAVLSFVRRSDEDLSCLLDVENFDEQDRARHAELHASSVERFRAEILGSGALVAAEEEHRLCELREAGGSRSRSERTCSGTKEKECDDRTYRHREYVSVIGEYFGEELRRPGAFLVSGKCELEVVEEEPPGEPPAAFSFDYQPDLEGHPGPSPSLILQALTMSNANDGLNLERLETIGDSFLKYAITTHLYLTYDNVHEGKLSTLRSKQVSNLNLYRLGRRKLLGESMIASKFEPHDNWLPPCYHVPRGLEQALIESGVPASWWAEANLPRASDYSGTAAELVRETENQLHLMRDRLQVAASDSGSAPFIPYNLVTQHSIPDKSVADCVEALIGAYLIACGPRGALLLLRWLGVEAIPGPSRPRPWRQLCRPPSPLGRSCEQLAQCALELERQLDGYARLEEAIGYRFRDRSYLLQAFTHASYHPNRLTDCYQRLEFLGDAVLDYLITRHLYEDERQHSPGALTDLRSALVNNTIFASLAVRSGFHRYFRHLSPGIDQVVERFVRIQEANGHAVSEECYLFGHGEWDEAEDVEVPKALGDIFESLAGAIYLDSGMSLDAVWAVYYRIMRPEIDLFSSHVPKSPVRELLELEPETAKFGRPEKLADGRRVRVTVDVFGKGSFKGIGRNYRIAKCTAAKCALKKLKGRTQQQQQQQHGNPPSSSFASRRAQR